MPRMRMEPLYAREGGRGRRVLQITIFTRRKVATEIVIPIELIMNDRLVRQQRVIVSVNVWMHVIVNFVLHAMFFISCLTQTVSRPMSSRRVVIGSASQLSIFDALYECEQRVYCQRGALVRIDEKCVQSRASQRVDTQAEIASILLRVISQLAPHHPCGRGAWVSVLVRREHSRRRRDTR